MNDCSTYVRMLLLLHIDVFSWIFKALNLLLIMRNYFIKPFLIFLLIFSFSCSTQTTEKSGESTERIFSFNKGDIIFDAGFEGSYLSRVSQIEENSFEIISLGENYPIDKSPTYAFKIITKKDHKIILNIHFLGSKAPATPKISSDGIHWETVPCDVYGSDLLMNVHGSANDTLWIARHPLFTSRHLNNWIKEISDDSRVHVSTCGKTIENRDIKVLDIYSDDAKDKDIIVFLARQHPTEVPGQFVFNTFIETLLAGDEDQKSFFDKNRIIAFPLVNADAVDHGRWRHNMNGVDLNRHWSDTTSQPEIKQITDYLKQISKEGRIKFAVDFHSRDGENIFIVREHKLLDMMQQWNKLIALQNPPETYKIQTSYNAFSVDNHAAFSSTWFKHHGIFCITHETTHDVDYEKAIASAKIQVKAFIRIMDDWQLPLIDDPNH